MTAMLTVMSGMDAHMIRVTWIGMVWMVEWLISLLLGQTTEVDSVVGSMSHLKEKSL
jgi:low temperature requirement protein LtrA